MRRPSALFALFALFALLDAGCVVPTPTPLAPGVGGSVGVPHQGVLTGAVALSKEGNGFRRLRDNGVVWGHPRLVATITHAAAAVAAWRPRSPPLVVGDLSRRHGGEAEGHRSHRTGRDVDLLLYALTPRGIPVTAPGFVRYGADGLAAKAEQKGEPRFYRFDVDRNWLLVRALLLAPDANVQWLFVARWLEALLVEHALARGEDPELVWHAETVLLQPGDSAPHDDHIHARIACLPEEAVAGCLGGGPYWDWLAPLPELLPVPDRDLAAAILDPP